MYLLEGDIADRIKMIKVAFAAFSMLCTKMEPAPREAVRAVAILLYSGTFYGHHITII
jgi:hypothetical protein